MNVKLQSTGISSTYNTVYETITIGRLKLGNNGFADFQQMLSSESLDTKARH